MSHLFIAGITVGFELPRYTVNERDGTLEVCVSLLDGSLERTVTLTLFSQDDSATSTDPIDFSAVDLQIQFDDSVSRRCAIVPITDDDRVELAEIFVVQIRSNDTDVELEPPTAVVTILDDDTVAIGFEMEQYQGEEGEMVEVCAILVDGALERTLIVELITEDISAQGSIQ